MTDFFTISATVKAETAREEAKAAKEERRIKEENDAYIKCWRKELSEFLAVSPDFYPEHVKEVLLRKLASNEDIYVDDLY